MLGDVFVGGGMLDFFVLCGVFYVVILCCLRMCFRKNLMLLCGLVGVC